MILSGGMNDADHIQRVFEETGVAAVMLARGCLGNPWLFEQTLGRRDDEPSRAEVSTSWRGSSIAASSTWEPTAPPAT
jgi:tRNA-dihydrouridine synthase